MKRHTTVVGITGGLVVLMVLALSVAFTPRADAGLQVDTPQEVAAPRFNEADWTIVSQAFESRYPNGFAFTLEASSSAGPIVSAEVEWVHRPHIRANEPLTVRRAEGEIDPNTGQIVAVWEPTQGTAVPPWVGVYYRWTLRDEAGNEFETEQYSGEYADEGNAWDRHESDDVLVFSTGLPANMGELVVEAMAFQRQKYIDGWGQELPYRPRVILFGDFDTWLEWQVGHQDTSGLGVVRVGVTSDEWGGTVQVLYGTPEELAYGTVLHEVEHLYQREFLAGRVSFTPGWFIEGDATFYQADDEIDRVASRYVQNLVQSGQLPVLLQGDGPTTVGENALHGYYMGYKFFQWLDMNWGIEMHRKIMNLLAEDWPFTDALEAATGMSVLELESAWRTWLGAPGVVPTLVPTWTLPSFLPTPTLMQFGSD